jgi:ubiquinone/menaquinone biosynthesis C-methylase UbiE
MVRDRVVDAQTFEGSLPVFTKSAKFYDAIYGRKDYQAEARRIRTIIEQHKRSAGSRLLDVACGTGSHLTHLHQEYAVEGLDLDESMLAIARERHPGVLFHRADMTEFDLGREFDVVISLFSSIGYVKTEARLHKAIRTMARHVVPGGLLIIEPFFPPEAWRPGHIAAVFVDQPDLTIARMSRGEREGEVGVLVFHYLVATPQGINYFTERHETGLFSHDAYLTAFRDCGLEVTYDPEGLIGRGLYVGRRPLDVPAR